MPLYSNIVMRETVLNVLPTKGIEPTARANVGNRESMSLLYKHVRIVTCVPQVHLWEVS